MQGDVMRCDAVLMVDRQRGRHIMRYGQTRSIRSTSMYLIRDKGALEKASISPNGAIGSSR